MGTEKDRKMEKARHMERERNRRREGRREEWNREYRGNIGRQRKPDRQVGRSREEKRWKQGTGSFTKTH